MTSQCCYWKNTHNICFMADFTADYPGAHFQYKDLCTRLLQLEKRQNNVVSHLKKSNHPASKQRSLINTYTNAVISLKTDLGRRVVDRLRAHRSFSPINVALKGKIARKVKPGGHHRQVSLPLLVEQVPGHVERRGCRKRASIYATME